MKLSNQFRGLDTDELQFLDEVAQEKRDAERAQKEKDEEQMRAFKWVAWRSPSTRRGVTAFI